MSVPSGTVTFLFTDVEGSTHRWEVDPEAMSAQLAVHDAIVRSTMARHHGHVFYAAGDSFGAAFERAADALNAAVEIRDALADAWGDEDALLVRAGLHTGDAIVRDGDYFGLEVNKAARLMAAANGGQIVCSGVAAELAAQHEPPDLELIDRGERHLRDLSAPVRVFEAVTRRFGPGGPLRTLDSFLGNLAPQMTSFINRPRDSAQFADALETHRLVSVVGPGGVGKTRLVVHGAAEMLPRFPGGAWFVDLAQIREDNAVGAAVAQALRLSPPSGMALEDAVADRVGRRDTLIILDNCEHVLGGAARLALRLLSACEAVRIVATSREPLRVPGEQICALGPMIVQSDVEAGAVALFTARALAEGQLLVPSDSELRMVMELCRRLDGIPLAIELAAARLRTMTLEDLLYRVDRCMDLLTGGSRTGPARHRTLEATVDWSYELLTASERRIFRRLTVFAGQFSIDDATRVCAEDGDEYSLIDDLTSLVDKSLVVVTAESLAPYRLLETLRDFGSARLDPAEAAGLVSRHARHFAAKAADAVRDSAGPDEQQAIDGLLVQLAEYRCATAWALAEGEEALAIRLARDCYWTIAWNRGASEPVHWLEPLQDRSDVEGWIELLGMRANLAAWFDSDLAAARSLGEEAVALDTGVASRLGRRELGVIALSHGSVDAAIEHLDAVTALSDDATDLLFISQTALISARARAIGGRSGEITVLVEELEALCEHYGSPSTEGVCALLRGELAHEVGAHDVAIEHMERAVRVFASCGHSVLHTTALGRLVLLLSSHGDIADATVIARRALDTLHGHRRDLTNSLELLSELAPLLCTLHEYELVARIAGRAGAVAPVGRRATELVRAELGDHLFDVLIGTGRSASTGELLGDVADALRRAR